MVHFNELIEIHRKHFESDHEVFAEIELIHSTDDVLFVLRILFVQVLDKFSLDETLFVESFLVFQDFQSAIFSVFVIIAFEYYAKTAFSNLLDYFVPIGQMFIDLAKILI